MGRLADLPPELLGEISENLAQDGEQGALAALTRQNRILYSIANPLLYRQPRITTLEQLGDWVSTMEHWQQPLNEEEEARQMPVIKSISLQGLVCALPSWPCDDCGSWNHRTLQHDQTLTLLLPLVLTHTFDHLHALSFVDCENPAELLPRLLGPLEPLRSTLKELTLDRTGEFHSSSLQFLLHLLHFFPDTSVSLNAVWEDQHDELDDDDDDDEVSVAEQLKDRARTDYEAFECLDVVSDGSDDDTVALILSITPFPHPFKRITTFKLGLESDGGEEMYIVLCSGLFPSLRRLYFSGWFEFWVLIEEERFLFRRAVHHSPPQRSGELRPPRLRGVVPDDEDALWEPLSAKEVASKAYTDYRGPSLDLLDLSGVTFNLQG